MIRQELAALYALEANNENVEKFGIPVLYYNGYLKGYPIMAITLLQHTLVEGYQIYGQLTPESQLQIYYQLVSTFIFFLLL